MLKSRSSKFLWIGIIVLIMSFSVVANNKQSHLSGQIYYRERIALLPNSIAHILLTKTEGGSEIVIGERWITDVDQVPIEFSLDYDTSFIEKEDKLIVRVLLTNEFGQVFWSETVLEAEDRNTLNLLVYMVTDGGENSPLSINSYKTDNLRFKAYMNNDIAYLFFSSDRYGLKILPSVASASGAKYQRDHYVFWTKENEALLEYDGMNFVLNRVNEDEWLYQLGKGFRGLGQEPGWNVQIDYQGRIIFTTDYGQKIFSAPLEIEEPLSPNVTRVYQAKTQAFDLTVFVYPVQSFDIMSGEPFPFTVKVVFEGQEYIGCGYELME